MVHVALEDIALHLQTLAIDIADRAGAPLHQTQGLAWREGNARFYFFIRAASPVSGERRRPLGAPGQLQVS
jgi:hypothetical protein